MISGFWITTINQRVFGFLAKFSGGEFYERQIARSLGISYGAANRALNDLYNEGAVRRRQAGKMYFYTVDSGHETIKEYKKLISMVLVGPLVESLKGVASRIVLYGSCAQGTDNALSDLDLFIVSEKKDKVMDALHRFRMPRGYESIKIQAVVKSTVELIAASKADKSYLAEVERGIVLWEKAAREPGV